MTADDTLAELHGRLDDLEARLKAKTAKARAKGSLDAQRKRELAKVQAHAAAMRHKLNSPKSSDWKTVKQDLEADWDILAHAFARWVEHVDEDF